MRWRLCDLYSNHSGLRNSPEYLLPGREALLRKIRTHWWVLAVYLINISI